MATETQAKGSLSAGQLDLLSGATAGFFVRIVEYPFDTIKVLQQTMGSAYKGPIDCLATTYRGGGIGALYKGLTAPLLGSMAECTTLFFSYGVMKRALGVDEDKATLSNPVPAWKYGISGAFSGACVAFVLTPVELIKCRLQVQSGMAAAAEAAGKAAPQLYKGPVDCITQVVRKEGPQGLWRGNLSCLVREIPGNVAWFGAYETVLRGIQIAFNHEKKSDVPLAWTALAGSAAGVAYWGVPFPADTVKSLQQTDERFMGRTFVDVFRTVLREDGVRGLYRGVGITVARAAPCHGLLFFAYEVAANQLRKL